MLEEYLRMIIGNSYDNALGKFYLETAKTMIRHHLNLDYLENGMYEHAIVMLAVYLYNNAEMLGLSQKKEGEVTHGFEDVKIPKHIKAMLPKPKVRWL